nr:hypothetical protein Iba_chr08dCG10250 [Ipomoea batatas]
MVPKSLNLFGQQDSTGLPEFVLPEDLCMRAALAVKISVIGQLLYFPGSGLRREGFDRSSSMPQLFISSSNAEPNKGKEPLKEREFVDYGDPGAIAGTVKQQLRRFSRKVLTSSRGCFACSKQRVAEPNNGKDLESREVEKKACEKLCAGKLLTATGRRNEPRFSAVDASIAAKIMRVKRRVGCVGILMSVVPNGKMI